MMSLMMKQPVVAEGNRALRPIEAALRPAAEDAMAYLEYANDSDEALMMRYRDGDYPAFEALYHRHSRRLYRFVAWQSPRIDWADEVAQDTWLRLHAARANYRPEAQFKTFLYQIAKNRLIDLMRQNSPVLASDLGDHDDGNSVLEYIADQNHQSETLESQVIRRDQQAHLREAIDSLPQEQKEALVLHQFSGMSLEEIAHLCGTPIETVKSRLRYAMQKLRRQLQSEAD